MSNDSQKTHQKKPTEPEVPLATPPPARQGEGWVQSGPTNTNKDPDRVLEDEPEEEAVSTR